jgi:hypothetical protein
MDPVIIILETKNLYFPRSANLKQKLQTVVNRKLYL